MFVSVLQNKLSFVEKSLLYLKWVGLISRKAYLKQNVTTTLEQQRVGLFCHDCI